MEESSWVQEVTFPSKSTILLWWFYVQLFYILIFSCFTLVLCSFPYHALVKNSSLFHWMNLQMSLTLHRKPTPKRPVFFLFKSAFYGWIIYIGLLWFGGWVVCSCPCDALVKELESNVMIDSWVKFQAGSSRFPETSQLQKWPLLHPFFPFW